MVSVCFLFPHGISWWRKALPCLLLAEKPAVQVCPSPSQGSASKRQSPRTPVEGVLPPALSTGGAVAAGFPFHCPGCDLDSCVPWRPHTWPTVVFILFTEGKGNLTGIFQKLQNARRRIPGYRPFRSLSLIQL